MSTNRLKFRAWDKKGGHMLDWMAICQTAFNNKNFNLMYELFTGNTFDFEVMQWTGLYDSEGVEIYENDVVDFTCWWFDGAEQETHLRGQVVYSPGNMSFQLKGVINKEWERHTGYDGDEKHLTPFSELNFCDADFFVLGNVHESPDLMDRSDAAKG